MSEGWFGPESVRAIALEANDSGNAVEWIELLIEEADAQYDRYPYGRVGRQVCRERIALLEWMLVDFRRIHEIAEEIVLISEAYEEGNISTEVYDEEIGNIYRERRDIRRRQNLLAETRA